MILFWWWLRRPEWKDFKVCNNDEYRVDRGKLLAFVAMGILMTPVVALMCYYYPSVLVSATTLAPEIGNTLRFPNDGNLFLASESTYAAMP